MTRDRFTGSLFNPKGESRADQIFATFKRFHAENPKVWTLFVRFTREAASAGHKHYSADAIMHRIRWEAEVATVGGEGVKVNNNFAAYYGRMFDAVNPDYGGFFRSRVRISEKRAASDFDMQVFIAPKAGAEDALVNELKTLGKEGH